MLTNYFKIALRYLIKNKVYTIINIAGITIGISTCLVVYLISGFELSYDRFHSDNVRIYRAVSSTQDPGNTDWGYEPVISLASSHIIRDECPAIEQIANFYSYHASVTIPGHDNKTKRPEVKYEQAKVYDMIVAEPEYFNIFQYKWLAGSPITAMNKPFKVVLTESKAKKYFGSISFTEIIGKQLIYDDSLRLTVSGIVKDWNKNTDLNFKDFISYSTIKFSFLKNAIGFDDPNEPDSWGEGNYSQTYIKLKKEIQPLSFNTWVANMIRNRRPVNMQGEKFRINLQPLSTLHFDEKYGDYYSRQAHLPTIYGLMGIATFILIIAVINFINLSTAQSIRRAKEIGIRKVLGSYRKNIAFQFLSETGIVVLFAVILSILIIKPVMVSFQVFMPAGLEPGELLNVSTLLFLIILTVLTILLAGLYPASVLSSYAPSLSLKGLATGISNQKYYLRKSLIVFQFAVSLFFIVATIIIGEQIKYMLNKDLGFNKNALVNINVRYINPNLRYTNANKELLANKIRKVAGVSMVSLNLMPVALGWNPTFKFKDKEKGTERALSCRMADENYVPLYGLKIIAGRNMMVPKNDSMTEFLVNESCAKQLGFKQPSEAIGYMMTSSSWTGPIVGVLADFYSQSLQKPISPLFIIATKASIWSIGVKMVLPENHNGNFKSILTNIEKDWKEIYPTEKFEYSFFNEDIARFYDEEQKNSKIMNASMGISIFISCMGLFGLATFTAGQRTKEIGIRKVLGATVSDIVSMLSKQFLKLVLISIIIASPVSWYFMHKWLQDYAYRINISWWVFVLAGLGAILIALFTVSFQAIKAAIANPIQSLRTE